MPKIVLALPVILMSNVPVVFVTTPPLVAQTIHLTYVAKHVTVRTTTVINAAPTVLPFKSVPMARNAQRLKRNKMGGSSPPT